MSGLQKGDRVTVSVPPRRHFNGVITGEGREKMWWLVLKDGTKHACGYAKSFCRPEQPTAEPQEKPDV
jgi:hypothetical protein